MQLNDKVKKFILEEGYLSSDKFDRLERLQKERKESVSQLLVSEGYLNEDAMLEVFSQVYNVPMLRLGPLKVEKEVIKLVPQKTMEMYELLPLSVIGKNLTIAFSDPLNIFAIDDLKRITGMNIIPVLSISEDIQKAQEHALSENDDLEAVLEEIEDVNESDVEFYSEDGSSAGSDEEAAEDAPVIKFVNLVLNDAIKKRASDIHFEVYEQKFVVRFRIDGVLKEAFHPPMKMHNPVTARLKIMADLDITEKRVPQDGRFRIRFNRKEMDFRLSTLPCVFGEKTVLRVLDKSNLQVGLEKLGFLPETLKSFQEAVKAPYGLILVTGPTGSGKSTTLYSVLNMLNTPDRNIMTVEDPVEYQVEGITQTQVKQEIGLTFAAGLRSLLRQSPDVILVGEIRDTETADIAVKSALTGHLVFSTLHTNSACGAVTRLIDMGVEPFLIASSLIMVAAQRLCRKICDNCKEEYRIPEEVFEKLSLDPSLIEGVTAYHGVGCSVCGNSGYYGRLATIECFTMTEEIKQLVIQSASSEEIQRAATQNGMKLLYDNLFTKFKLGLTTLEEVMRLSSAD